MYTMAQLAACSCPADSEGSSACTPEEVEENVKQQGTELEMLQNIYSSEITVVKEDSEFLVAVTPQFDDDVQLVLPTSSGLPAPTPMCDTVQSCKQFTQVTHLPPIELYVKYHSGYPSKKPPNFHISARWLDPKLVPAILENLEQLFTPDCPVVFQCITYLQDELVRDYSCNQSQDDLQPEFSVQPPDSVDACDHDSGIPHSNGPSSSLGIRHPCQIFLRSTSQLDDMEEYDWCEVHQEFLQSKHECGICVSELLGKEFCEPCHSCNQLFCKDCILGYCHVCVGDGQVSHLQCPNQRCTNPLSDPFLQSILSKEMFERYVHLRNEVQLDSVPGMVFCPRTSCGSRVVSEPDSSLAVCPQCMFPFCKVCKQTWHGPGACPALEKIGTQLGDEAEAGTVAAKKKKQDEQDQRRIEELKSLVWMRSGENARPCPKCQSMIQKSGGCNKMNCRSCGSCFCWLCGKQIAGYNHFTPSSCPLFRPEDYLPPREAGPDVDAPNDQQLLQDVLMSKCPRCEQVESKINNHNWIHCRKCRFQFCHLCREACFGAWHFSKYGCKRITGVKEDLAILTQERKRKEQ